MITEKVITVPIYKYIVKILVCDTIIEAKDKYDHIPDDCNGAEIDYGDKSMIVVTPDSTSVIVHECHHLKSAIFKRIGHITTPENDEVDSYLIEYLFEEVMKVVRKHLKKSASLETGDDTNPPSSHKPYQGN